MSITDGIKIKIYEKMKLFYFDIEVYKELNLNLDISYINTIKELEKTFIRDGLPKNVKYSIYDIYEDFDWEKYKLLNPYLYIIGLRKKEEYERNYILEGRYKARYYKDEHLKNMSIHVLLATIGKKCIFKILMSLVNQLHENDYLTIVFDALDRDNILNDVKNMKNFFKCKINIIFEEKSLGYWGHGIRNKYVDLEGDFVYHVDDDDDLYEDSFNKIRKHCKNKKIIYIFKIKLENNTIVWDKKKIKLSKISTQSGVIPIEINKTGYWQLRYGGDFDYYNDLSKKNNIVFIDELIYKKY